MYYIVTSFLEMGELNSESSYALARTRCGSI